MDGDLAYDRTTLDRAAFAEQVQDALAHLYDHVYLQQHPLALLLSAGPGEETRGRTLHRLLLEAIGQLKPDRDAPHFSTAWRKHQYFFLRYVEGRSALEAADDLAISERQSRRYHREALEAVISVLWETYESLSLGQAYDAPPGGKHDGMESPPDWRTLLKAEVERLGCVPGPATVALPAVLSNVVSAIGNLAEGNAVRVQVDLEPDLPPISADRVKLRQVLFNVLTHAIRRATQGSLLVRATGDARGISIEVRSKHVSPEGAAPVEEDTAQLEVARHLLADSQGALELLADDPSEWCLHLTLPSACPTTVLVVDDNPDIVQLFRRFLAGRPYQVVAAGSGQEALDVLGKARPRIITLDVMMPSQDGWDLLQVLRNLPETREVPIVVCSVLRERDLALSLGASDFLAKPVTQQALLTALDRCLAGRAVPQSLAPGGASARQ